MGDLNQNAKELLAIAILKEFGCFDEAKKLAKDNQGNPLDLKGLPSQSIDYLLNRFELALQTMNQEDQ